ncbi:ADP-ribose pyrophosphatase [Acetobacter cibinongensis]|uniref:GDP-mannose pyrophosphatase n=1 Tax=Acetobacter cibinongensis TaxID=146475 RepID=A0A0D6N5T3_9PROT|nr:NUDIX hydrolase [Acetobacter cibinongensis]GAN60933.1 ADP-ribose pyrophosphatase [Acetobacter cibinongensis]GBQ13214.1 ADP-ribose pyrophosphatase [Acetobacter cibinongensis NRIC 0482]GEL58570.1 ADP-ribose pyrophosphatase [Acetobacter cibinongensis]
MTNPVPDAGGYLVLSTRIAYENPWTRVREDIIRRPNGKDGLYGVVERGQFVVILPLGRDENGKPTITLINQYRYPIGQRLWELPMGMWESRPDATPAEVAAGELREETGLSAGAMHHAGIVYQGAGYSTQKGHVYLATDLTQGATQLEETEQDITCHTFSLEKVEDMIRKNEITCMVTLAAFGLLKAQNLI